MPAVDVHQHLWPQEFVQALSARRSAPRLNGTELELAGERASHLHLASHELDVRLELLDRAGIDVAVVSLQPTLGLEGLAAGERAELVATWEEGIRRLAREADGRIVPLAAGDDPTGFPGACIAAPRLLDLDGVGPLLDRLARDGGFLFVHPGGASTPDAAPVWWPAVVDYTAQMHAAYAMWLSEGATRWPTLRVVFAILAGGAPIQLERLRSRGFDERRAMLGTVWFDVASYGPRALELALSTYGVDRLVFGTDVPVVAPEVALDAVRSFGDAVTVAVLEANPVKLLTP